MGNKRVYGHFVDGIVTIVDRLLDKLMRKRIADLLRIKRRNNIYDIIKKTRETTKQGNQKNAKRNSISGIESWGSGDSWSSFRYV